MRGYVLFVGVFLFLFIGFVDAAPPLWLKPNASFTYHGYGSSNAGAATVFMTYTVQSAGAGGAAVRRDSTEATYGTNLESKVLSYPQTDQAGDFWLDISQTLKPGDTIMVHTDVGYIPATLQTRGPLDMGDPQYNQKHFNDVIIFSMTSTGSDRTTQLNYNYYFNGENGLLISYSEYMGANLGKPEQNLASRVIIYLIKADADFTTVSQKPPASTAAQASPQGTSPTISGKDSDQQSSLGCSMPSLTLLLAFSSALAAKVTGF
ncbi:MAG: hypothetical protein V1744_00820 [Candidatus Altiarchaeota archaeon]